MLEESVAPGASKVIKPLAVAAPVVESTVASRPSAGASAPFLMLKVWLAVPPARALSRMSGVAEETAANAKLDGVSVKVKDANPILPAILVSLATMVWTPAESPTGVKLQTPFASAVAVVELRVPSIEKLTTAFGSLVPVKVGFEAVGFVAVPDGNLSVSVTDG
jgi:hypothetical protein